MGEGGGGGGGGANFLTANVHMSCEKKAASDIPRRKPMSR